MADPLTILGLSYAGKEAVAVVGQFTRDVFGPSAKALGEGVAAPVQAWALRRAERAKSLVVDASLAVDRSGASAHPVPGRVLFPILEHGSVEEDESLRSRWVALLASAAVEPNSVPPAFPSILAELSPSDARLLEWLHTVRADAVGVTLQRAARELGLDLEATGLSVANLERLRLVIPSTPLDTIDKMREHQLAMLYRTSLGEAFWHALQTPRDGDDAA